MPTIPIYQSQVSPSVQVQQPFADANAFGAQVAGAVGEVEDGVIRRHAEAQQIERQRAREDAVADAAVKVATNSGATATAVQTARDAAPADAAGHVDSVLKDFDARADGIIAGIADPRVAAQTRAQLAVDRAGVITKEGAWAAATRAGAMATNVGLATDTAANALYTAPSWHDLNSSLNNSQTTIDALNLPPAEKAKLQTHARSRLAASYIQGLTEKNPYAAREALQSGQLNGLLDADNMSSLGKSADSAIRGQEAEQRRAQAEARAEQRRAASEARQEQRDRAREVGDRIEDFKSNVALGVPVSAADVKGMTTAAYAIGRPELARGVAQVGIASVQQQELRGATPVQVQAAVTALDASIAEAGANPKPAQLIRREAAKAYLSGLRRDLNADPLARASADGVVRLAAIDPAQPATLSARVAAVDAVRRRYGVPVAPLTAPELDGYRSTLANGGPAEKLRALQELGGLGKYRGAAMRQIGGIDPVHGHVGMLTGARGGASTAADALTGFEIAKAKPELLDKGRATTLNDYVGGALARLPQLQASLRAVADGVYVARRSRAGETEWSSTAYGGALGAALGAYRDPSGQLRGGVGSYGQQKVLLPDDVSEDEFGEAMGALAIPDKGGAVDRRGRPIDAATLKSMPLVSLGGGRYAFGNDARGSTVAAMADGQPFVVTISHRAPR